MSAPKDQTFWIVTPDGTIHGLLGSRAWAVQRAGEIARAIEGKVAGPFRRKREAEQTASAIKGGRAA